MRTRNESISISGPASGAGPIAFAEHPILSLPLNTIIKPHIALMLQHLMRLHTVGALLDAWRDELCQHSIEQIFDSPEQARHAVAVCATWLGLRIRPVCPLHGDWWVGDEPAQAES